MHTSHQAHDLLQKLRDWSQSNRKYEIYQLRLIELIKIRYIFKIIQRSIFGYIVYPDLVKPVVFSKGYYSIQTVKAVFHGETYIKSRLTALCKQID